MKESKATIGLEIHAELATATKMFCGCPNPVAAKGGGLNLKPNSLVCPVCLGLPGSLPYANEQAVLKTYEIARALGCKLADQTWWERKSYFYPDLPKGFQISQYTVPIGTQGSLAGMTVRRVHLEEDTGKLLHPEGADPDASVGTGYSLVDYNRSGVPLVEMVTEPEIRSAKQAVQLAKEYQLILRYLGVSEADMEKGQLRVEANISVAPNSKFKIQKSKLGTKVEVKNLNSFRAVERAIEYELKRQTELINSGKKVVQETRGWSEAKQATFSQRTKETESDYRYFQEPDLPPVTESLKSRRFGAQSLKLPELPEAKRAKFRNWSVAAQYIEVLVAEVDLAKKLEGLKAITKGDKGLLGRIASLLVNRPETRSKSDQELIELARLPEHQLKSMIKGERIETQAVPEATIVKAAEKVLAANTKAVSDYQKGKQAAAGFLVGQVMRQIKNADPKLVKKILEHSLKLN